MCLFIFRNACSSSWTTRCGRPNRPSYRRSARSVIGGPGGGGGVLCLYKGTDQVWTAKQTIIQTLGKVSNRGTRGGGGYSVCIRVPTRCGRPNRPSYRRSARSVWGTWEGGGRGIQGLLPLKGTQHTAKWSYGSKDFKLKRQ